VTALTGRTKTFIYNTKDSGRGLHLARWETITYPQRCGGVGVREARLANIALLEKLV